MSSCQFSKPQHATATRNGPFHLKPQKKTGFWAWNNDGTKGFMSSEQSLGSCCCYMLLYAATLPTCTPRAQHMLEVLVHFNLCLVTAWWLQVIRFECRCATMGPSGIRTSAHTPTVSVHMQLTEHSRAEKHVNPPISTQHLKTIHLNLVQTNPSPEFSYYHNVYMRVLGATGTWLGSSLPCITT